MPLYVILLEEPRDCRSKDLGSVIELSMDHLFMATSSSDQIKYQWSVIIKGEDISEDEGCFKNRDSERLTIDCFESKLAGIYKCVISTSTQPVVSISAEVQLHLPGKYESLIYHSIVVNYPSEQPTIFLIQNFLKFLILE